MAELVIDITSSTWRAVVEFAAARRAELANECCALSTAPEKRAELAARVAELDDLVDAPAAAARAAQMRRDNTKDR